MALDLPQSGDALSNEDAARRVKFVGTSRLARAAKNFGVQWLMELLQDRTRRGLMIALPSVRRRSSRLAVGTTMQETKPGRVEMSRAPARAPASGARSRPSGFAAAHLEEIASGDVVAYLPPARLDARTRPIGGLSKRIFDVAVSLSALVFLAPFLLLIALAVRLDSAGPAIFRQERGGFRRKTFRVWKFRTMTVMDNTGIVQVRKHDARVTKLGAFLRRSSLDELPQLFNVLIGDMSIVGPRPHALEHDVQFEKVDPRYGVRFRARPGVTGLAQVSGCRGPTETDSKIRARTRYDLEYVRTWSWGRELNILIRTAALFWKDDPGAV